MLDIHHLPGSTLKESKIFVFRRHPITLIPLAIATLLVLILPVGSYLFFQAFHPDFLQNPTNLALYALGASALFLIGWFFVFQIFMEYWLDVFIITDKRILDIDQHGLFGRTISESRLYRTQDVTSNVKGILQTIFDYGDVQIQTAGEKERFAFEDVAHPQRIAKMILELSEADRKENIEETVSELSTGHVE